MVESRWRAANERGLELGIVDTQVFRPWSKRLYRHRVEHYKTLLLLAFLSTSTKYGVCIRP
jgi:hypothetical protein